MNLEYDRNTLVQGNNLRKQAEERPSTFAEYNGAVDPVPSGELDKQSSGGRKAGQMGQRALELMTNPEAQAVTSNWMNLYSQSNPGVEFYRDRIQLQLAQAQAQGGPVV